MYRIQWRRGVSRKLLEASAKAESDPLTDILGAMSTIESLLHNEPEFVGESRTGEERLAAGLLSILCVNQKLNHEAANGATTGAKVAMS